MSDFHDNIDDFREYYKNDCSYNLVRSGEPTSNVHMNLFYDFKADLVAIHGNDVQGTTLDGHIDSVNELIKELLLYREQIILKYQK